eukprot:gene32240-39811_t
MDNVMLLGSLKNLIPESNKAAHQLIDKALANNAAMCTRGDHLSADQLKSDTNIAHKESVSAKEELQLSNTAIARRNRTSRQFKSERLMRTSSSSQQNGPPMRIAPTLPSVVTPNEQQSHIATVISVLNVEGQDEVDVVQLSNADNVIISVTVEKNSLNVDDNYLSDLKVEPSSTPSNIEENSSSGLTSPQEPPSQEDAQDKKWFRIQPTQVTPALTSHGLALPLS